MSEDAALLHAVTREWELGQTIGNAPALERQVSTLIGIAERAMCAATEARLCEIEAAARAYVGTEPLELLARMDSGETLIGAMANPKWTRLLRSLAAREGTTR
jgi:hypothetical protein